MAHVEMARGRLLPEAIVRRRQVHCLLDITCLIFWLYRSPRGLVVFPELLQIKYGPLRCFKITWQTEQGSDCTHIGRDKKKEKLFSFTCISLWAIPKKHLYCLSEGNLWFFYGCCSMIACFAVLKSTQKDFFWLLNTDFLPVRWENAVRQHGKKKLYAYIHDNYAHWVRWRVPFLSPSQSLHLWKH